MWNPFKRKKTVDDIFDKKNGLLTQVGGFIGNMKLTNEEVMESNARTVASVQEFAKSTLDESTERSASRRSIANKWITVQLGIIIMSTVVAPFDRELAAFYFDLAVSDLMLLGTGAILVFHFGSHGLSKFQDKKKASK